MANITFMIGNGFDLACALKSAYTDTYDGYIQVESNSKAIAKFKRIIKRDKEDRDYKNWCDFEMALAEHARCFQCEADFIECVCDYTEYLAKHLEEERRKFISKYSGNPYLITRLSQEMRRSIENFYEGLTPNSVTAIQSALKLNERPLLHIRRYISFNYTDAFDQILDMPSPFAHEPAFDSAKKRSSSVMHIHGKLSGNESGVILGVDNVSQISNLSYKLSDDGKRCIVKPIMTDYMDDKRKNETMQIVKGSDVICIYGWSLGESDLTWKNVIAEWLRMDNKHQLVYYKHAHASVDRHLHAFALKAVENKAKNELAKKLFGDDESVNIVEQQIHIPVGYDIFNFGAYLGGTTKT